MLNVVVITGRLAATPELRYTPNNIPVVSFTLAVGRNFASKSESGDRPTDWIDMVAWRTTAEFITKYFTKGQLLTVRGSIQTRNYEDKQGNKRKAVEVVVEEAMFAESKKDRDNTYPSAPPLPRAEDAPPVAYSSGTASDFIELPNADDLPF